MNEVQKVKSIYSLLKKMIGLTLGLTLFCFSGFATANNFCSEKLNYTELRISLGSDVKTSISFVGIVQQLHTTCFISDCAASLIFSVWRFDQSIEVKTLVNSKELQDVVEPAKVLKTQFAPRKSTDIKSDS